MRIYDNGVYRDMTKEETQEMEKEMAELPPPVPTPEQEIIEVKAQFTAMQAAYKKGVNA